MYVVEYALLVAIVALIALAECRLARARRPFRTARCIPCGRLVRPRDGRVERAGDGGIAFVCSDCW